MADYKRLYEVQTQIGYLTKEHLENVLAEHTKDIKEFAYILHDKDEDKDGTLKKPHWHIELKLYKSRRRSDIAKWFGLSERCVQDSKSGRYDDMILYLIHENAPEKHHYEAIEVSSNFNYTERLETIQKGKIKIDKDARRDELIEMAASGTIRRFNYTNFITASEWNTYNRAIKNAWDYRDTAIRSTQRNMEVIYICGTGRCGKSTLADQIAERKGYTYEHSGSNRDPMQAYLGHDCYILDDIRGSTFEFEDLMGILDNFKNRDVPSRYRDRSLSECKLIIITTTQSIEDFFKELAEERPEEPPQQLYGRCGTLIEMDRDFIRQSEYDDEKQEYTDAFQIRNRVLDDIKLRTISDETERRKRAAGLLGVEESELVKVEKEPEGVIGNPIPFEAVYPTIPPEIAEEIKHNPLPYLDKHPEHKPEPLALAEKSILKPILPEEALKKLEELFK